MKKKSEHADIDIGLVTDWPEKDIVNLYKAGGWWKPNDKPSSIKSILNGSFAVAVAIDTSTRKAVGMGRLLSDGISDAYIQDIIVLPEYRQKGLGKSIVKTLVDYCLKRNISWIALISEPGQEKFYKGLGFQLMKKYCPMKYQPED